MRMTILSAVATQTSSGILVADYRNCLLQIKGSTNADLKVFIKGAMGRGDTGEIRPNFNIRSSNRTAINAWDFVQVVDLQDGTTIAGDTGINLSGNMHRIVEVNINKLDYIAVESTGIVAGTVTVVGVFTTNE